MTFLAVYFIVNIAVAVILDRKRLSVALISHVVMFSVMSVFVLFCSGVEFISQAAMNAPSRRKRLRNFAFRNVLWRNGTAVAYRNHPTGAYVAMRSCHGGVHLRNNTLLAGTQASQTGKTPRICAASAGKYNIARVA